MMTSLPILKNLLPFVPYAYKGESVACPICDSNAARMVCRWDRRIKPLRTVVCEDCGLLRTDPMPTAEDLQAYYAAGYRLDYQGATRTPPRFHLVRSARDAEARYATLAPGLPANARILDFGCGSGEFLDRARRAGHDAVGVEPGRTYASYAEATYGVRVYDSLDDVLAAEAAPFDLVTASHVLEHVRDPVAVLKALAGALAPDGLIHVAVPNFEAMAGQSFERFHLAHVYNFTPWTLALAGWAAGIEPDERFPNHGTEIVFRKRATGPSRPPVDPAHADRVAALCAGPSPAAFLLSGRWIVDAVRRGARDLRDSVSPKLRATPSTKRCAPHSPQSAKLREEAWLSRP